MCLRIGRAGRNPCADDSLCPEEGEDEVLAGICHAWVVVRVTHQRGTLGQSGKYLRGPT